MSLVASFKEKFIGDKNFYKRVLLIALPMIGQNAITSFVSFLDNIMVGMIGTEQMSGVAIVNQLVFVFNICIFGGVSGAGIFGTQFFGKGDYEGQKYTFRFKLIASFVLVTIALLLGIFAGTELIQLYLSDSGDVGNVELALDYGKQYMAIMLFGLAPFALGQTYVSSIRETGHTLIPMLAGVVAMVTNLVLDVVLIFGLGPIPTMGVQGAAIATVIARFVEAIVVVLWTHAHKEQNKYIVGAYRNLYIPRKILKDILIKGTPLMLNEMFWATGMAAIVQCYAVRGLEVVAAQNISSTITNLFNTVYLQLGGCISIIIGQLLGAGKIQEAKETNRKLIFFNVVSCVGIALIMIVVGRWFPNIYATEESIKELARIFIVISAVVMPLNAFCHCTYFTLRSGGKTVVTFLFDSVYTWVLVIPVATVLAKYTTLPIGLVFFLVQSLEFVKAIIGFFMVKSGVWLQNIVAEKETR
ncbi:MAG: MATE family efflux transporter [Agathobacter sp.]|nr:MATE family efflux transporter [Agathobacter sp.]